MHPAQNTGRLSLSEARTDHAKGILKDSEIDPVLLKAI